MFINCTNPEYDPGHHEDATIGMITAIVSGSLFIASEILPFIRRCDGNGLLHVIYKFIRNYPVNNTNSV